MTNRSSKEYNKFSLQDGSVIMKTAEGVGSASAVFDEERNDLESNKFTGDGSIRIMLTF